jgi:hypothetical protein
LDSQEAAPAGLAADWANVVDEAESDAPPDNDNLNTPTPAASPRAESAPEGDTAVNDLDDEIPF